MQRRMGELARHADLITPNLTEACMLLGQPYRFAPLGVQEAKTLLLQLADLGPSTVVLTGVQMESNRVTNLGYDRNSGSFWRAAFEHLPVNYPGTRRPVLLRPHRGPAERGQPPHRHGAGRPVCGACHENHLQLSYRPPLWRDAGNRPAPTVGAGTDGRL